ncbi:MAG: carbohydrate ABC transporter permease [Thermomicrobiales bacterium]|nr:carbohydrate ABC transporter permease [Thermomicrobiales bacterium]MCO5217473.1 carbohydrate ABC transporter permease [Thermomicrobiales bacterium]MCO5223954.1 carbohydrate ABC transporter permease [Thermomicrobiales bacterium]MCO5226768.1 carbohydrate ABC transporter permease [Thermomicrobiales bacterium]
MSQSQDSARMHKTIGDRIYQAGVIIFLVVAMSLMIIPFWNVVAVAFSSAIGSMSSGIILWPRDFTVNGFEIIWKNLGLERAFMNSVIVTFFGTIAHVLLACLAGYVLIQKDLPGKRLLVGFILATMAIPGELIIIPLFVVYKSLGLLDSLFALILSGMVSGFSILLMRNFFSGVPFDLAESARIDGASDFRIFASIYMPLAKAGIATIALFEMVGRWNMFLPVILYINDSSKYTLQVVLRSLVTENQGNSGTSMITPNVQMAGILIAVLPLLLLYPIMQRYFVKGISLGAVKE